MEASGISFFTLILIGAGVGVLLLLVLVFSVRRASAKTADSPTVIPPTVNDSDDEPTAPIVPMVEMSRSPHDRHRDLTVAKAIIKRIDQLDAMIKSAAGRNDSDMSNQLGLFRDEMIALLRECEVEKFQYAAGTPVDVEMRHHIQIVGGDSKGGPSRIAETVRCGFRYIHGDEDTMILRKAEVVIC